MSLFCYTSAVVYIYWVVYTNIDLKGYPEAEAYDIY